MKTRSSKNSGKKLLVSFLSGPCGMGYPRVYEDTCFRGGFPQGVEWSGMAGPSNI
jgi:hypothetical protein